MSRITITVLIYNHQTFRASKMVDPEVNTEIKLNIYSHLIRLQEKIIIYNQLINPLKMWQS
jgi:hypothetical protein